MSLDSEYHYDGNCGVAKIFMRLSGWTLHEFALDTLPNGYVENGDFGPRVEKYDWLELLTKFPFLFALLVIAAIAILFWLFWLCCKVRGLQKSKKKRHSCCLCFTTFLLLLLLLPLAIGLYLTFRTNYLLRRIKDDSRSYKGAVRSALDDEQENPLPQTDQASPSPLSEELNKVITNELTDWQQIIARNGEKNFEQLKYLYTNREFYRNSLQSLKDYAYDLVILGLEMDDLLRTFYREAFIFLQATITNVALKESKIVQSERINVWHLNTVYLQYAHSLEHFEYLLEAYENISLIQKSIAESRPNAAFNENDLYALNLRGFPNVDLDNSSAQREPKIPSAILYVAMVMFFVTAALVYIFLMALAFGVCRYYERANCMFKIFLFLNFLTIPVLACLTILHFLPAMVLHNGICHEHMDRSHQTAEFRERTSFNNIAPKDDFGYENDELSPTEQMQDKILTKIVDMLPKNNIQYKNFTNNQHVVEEFPQEKWYESDVQGLITKEDLLRYEDYIKQYSRENTTDADIFSCKLNAIPNAVKTNLYSKQFVPIATELYGELTKFRNFAETTDYGSFIKRLESAENELTVFDKFYALSKDNFWSTLEERLDKKLKRHSKAFRYQFKPCSANQRSAINQPAKCGCLEDLLIIFALGSALLVLTLFFAMLLSLLLYKLYKRGPTIYAGPQRPSIGGYSESASRAVNNPACLQNAGEACTSKMDGKDCVVNIKSGLISQGTNCAAAQTSTPLINTVNFIPPVMGAFGCQQYPPMTCSTNCQPNPTQMRATSNPTQLRGGNLNDDTILPLPCRSRTQMNCAGTEAQLVGGGSTRDKTVTVMVFQGPKDRQPLVTYPPPCKLEKK